MQPKPECSIKTTRSERSMGEVKRINQRIDFSPNSTGNERRRKQPTKPPKNAEEAQRIIEALYERNPLLSLTSSMSALTGLRYSDASWLKFSDFFDEYGNWKNSVDVCQQKTYRMRIARENVDRNDAYTASLVRIYVNDDIKDVVNECQFLSCSDEFLFANKRSSIKTDDGQIIERPMDIRSANYHHSKVHSELGLNYPLNTHSWRKYFAKKLVSKRVTVEKIRDFLGQSSLNSTNHYLSTFDEELAPLIGEMRLFE